MGKSWRIATIGGIPIFVTSTWALAVIVVTWSRYAQFTNFMGIQPSDAWILAGSSSILFFGSVAVHEAAHAVVARAFEMPVHGITLVFWGGFTETPSRSRGPLVDFLVSIAGPASTLAIAALFFVLAGAMNGLASDMVRNLAELELLFAAFNALPGQPLDGGHAFSAIVWGITRNRRLGERLSGYTSMAIGVAMFAAGIWSLRQNNGWFIFLFFIGAQLFQSGRATDKRIAIRDRLAQGRVSDAMRPPTNSVPAEMSLSEALDRFLRGSEERSFPVVEDGRTIGVVSLRGARKVGARDPLRHVRDGMVPIARVPVVHPQLPLDDAVDIVGRQEGLVLDDGRLVGALSINDIDRWFQGRATEQPTGRSGAVPPPRPDL